jgi:hypothetical protein
MRLHLRHARLQVLEHPLQLLEHRLGLIARTALHHLLGLVEHLLQLLAIDHLRRVDRLHLHVRRHVPPLLQSLLSQLVEITVHRLPELVHQRPQLLVGGPLLERSLQRILDLAQRPFGNRKGALLDHQGELPQEVDHRAPRRVVAGLVERERPQRAGVVDAVTGDQVAVPLPADRVRAAYGDLERPLGPVAVGDRVAVAAVE